MNAVFNIIKSLLNLIRYLLSPLKRAVCRRRRSSESDLPLVMDKSALSIDMTQSYPSNNDIQMEPWDNWSTEDRTPQYTSTQQHITNYRKNLMQKSEKSDLDPEPEPDYFGGMEPDLKKTAKIYIKKKEDHANINRSSISNRLAMVTDVPVQGSELDAWQDEPNAWDEVNEDLSYEADMAIKEKRRAERHQRNMEQQKRKMERDSKLHRKDLVSVKLS